MSEYAPGTIAVATVRGVENARVMRRGAAGSDWSSAVPVGASFVHPDRYVTDVRPLVVLDLHGKEIAGNPVGHLLSAADYGRKEPWPAERHSLIVIAEQIEAQTKRPIAEPTGMYAAVADVHGSEFVRLGNGPRPWMHNGSPSNCDTYSWAQIAAVRVLAEGVAE